MTDIQVWLGQGKKLADKATEGPWDADGREVTQNWQCKEPWQTIVSTEVACAEYCYGGSAEGVNHEEDAEFIADARTRLPLALDALQAVLEIHQNHRETNGEGPCPTVKAIHDAIGEVQS